MNSVSSQLTQNTAQALQADDRLVFTPETAVLRNTLIGWIGAPSLLGGLFFVILGIGDILGIVKADGSALFGIFGGGLFALFGYRITALQFRLSL